MTGLQFAHKMKNKNIIRDRIVIISLLVLIFFISFVYAWADHERESGYNQFLNYSMGDMVVHEVLIKKDLNVSNNVYIDGNLEVDGLMTGTLSLGYHEENVSDGNISYHAFYLGVLGEGGGNDDVDNIIGGVKGDVINIFPIDSSSDIKLKHGTGNLDLDGSDCDLKSTGTKAELRKTNGNWKIVVCLN